MSEGVGTLRRALTAFAHPRTASKINNLVRAEGAAALDDIYRGFSTAVRKDVDQRLDGLHARGINAMIRGDDLYPTQLASAPGSPAILFYWGNPGLLGQHGISMCGSRNVSPLGLQAAAACGGEVARHGMVVMSGYARGVDMETHLAALDYGGDTVIVLAEGIDHFRVKKAFPPGQLTPERAVAVSQFAPSQPWSAGGAMTRNAVIVGLGLALVVVEAGDRGGTLAAGMHALKAGRPVLVLSFDANTPVGNVLLLERGARPISSRAALGNAIGQLRRDSERTLRERHTTDVVSQDVAQQMVLG